MLCFVNYPFTKRSMDDQIAAESQIARAKPVAERVSIRGRACSNN